MKYLLSVFSSLVLSVSGTTEIEVMKTFSNHIGNLVLECQDEMGFDQKMINEFMAFWNAKHALTIKDQGCVVACILNKLELLEEGGTLKEANVVAFGKANGADAALTAKLRELYLLCSRAAMNKSPKDGCVFSLEIAKCFRYGIFTMHWAPAFNVDYKDEVDDTISQPVKRPDDMKRYEVEAER